ncbi:MAG: SRPBCC family protein [Kofleriaceae bacterium]|nr:SRPBCC family protein [Kofleriaceae bacterium]
MPTIELSTRIDAPIEVVFDLARDVDAHLSSASQTGEVAVAGKTSGLLELGDWVTWEAKHLSVRQRLTVEISEMNRPHSFEDRMLRGAFSSMVHRHEFEATASGTLMHDRFRYRAPIWGIGRLAETLFLTAYMRRFLVRRNLLLKEMAEGL